MAINKDFLETLFNEKLSLDGQLARAKTITEFPVECDNCGYDSAAEHNNHISDLAVQVGRVDYLIDQYLKTHQ